MSSNQYEKVVSSPVRMATPIPATNAPAPKCSRRPTRPKTLSRIIKLSVNIAAARNGSPKPQAQERYALRHGCGDGARRQDGAEHRANAGRPAKGKRDADQISGDGVPTLETRMKAELALQP